jgi:RNA polymerase sigma-70 factor (ECF subfamily)
LTQPLTAEHDPRDLRDLVRDAQLGHIDAFDALMNLYVGRVFRFVRARVPESEAEDVTQLVFVQMIEALPRYQERGIPFGSWLFTIARHAVIDAVRRPRDLPLDAVAMRISPSPGPAELADRAAGAAELREAIRTLPADQRDVITLRFFADLSTREIAESLRKHEGHVRVLQFRALRGLRRRLVPRLGRLIESSALGAVEQ